VRGGAGPTTTAPAAELKSGRRAVAGALVLLLATFATGAATSPLLPLFVAVLIFAVRFVAHRAILIAPPAAGVLLILLSYYRGSPGVGAWIAALSVVVAAVPGLWWRRESRRSERSLEKLDDILAQAHRGSDAEAPTAADNLADLERALAAAAARIGASTLMLWDVDGYHGTARPRAGHRKRAHPTIRISGDPLGWTWEQGVRMRLESTPRWADDGLVIVTDRLRRHGDHGEVLSYGFEPGRMPADDLPFEETAIYIRGILTFQEARAGAAADKRRLRTLLHGLTRTPGELDIESFAPELCHTAAELVEGTGAALAFWHGDHGTVLAAVGGDGGPRPGDIFGPPASELALAVRADAMLVRTAGEWNLGRTNVVHPHERWDARPRCLAALPLRTADGTIGVLAVWSSRAPTFDPELLDLLHMMGPYAAIHLHHAMQYGSIKESAARDPLTLLRNRRSFDDVFGAETARFDRYGRPLALLMLDLDHFKAVNDRYGHEAGDEVLRRAAAILAECVRDVDTVARFGGEEFVVLMPETPLKAALEAGERIRAAIEATPVPWRGSSIPLTISIGVAAAPEIVATPAELISSADVALYDAKGQGRNRVCATVSVR
jgi:diguanylate cyclase (GGDEF)-like protein